MAAVVAAGRVGKDEGRCGDGLARGGVERCQDLGLAGVVVVFATGFSLVQIDMYTS